MQMRKLKALIIALATLAGGLAYRLGGSAKNGGWLDFARNTKTRDAGVSAVSCLILACFSHNLGLWQWLSLIPTFGLSWASLTTYRYFLPKPKNYGFVHYVLHGFMVALATIFFAWATGHWFWFGIRCLICAAGVGAWSHLIKNDILEESGRGIIITGSSWLLTI